MTVFGYPGEREIPASEILDRLIGYVIVEGPKIGSRGIKILRFADYPDMDYSEVERYAHVIARLIGGDARVIPFVHSGSRCDVIGSA